VTEIAPGWYKDPAEPTTQRYWDGGGWVGAPVPADATPPDGPPPPEPEPPAVTLPDPTQPERVATGSFQSASAPPTTQGPPAGTGTGAPQPEGHAPLTAPPGWPYGYPAAYAGVVPAPRPHGLALASVGTRFVARIVDVLVVLVLSAIANVWFAIQFWQSFQPWYVEFMKRGALGDTQNLPTAPETTSTLFLLMCIATTAVWFAYEVPASANSGQTLGKRLLGIKVVRMESADRLGFGRSFRRWSRLGLPTLLWYCCGVGFLLQLIDCLFAAIDRPLHQALHDKTAATVVVQVPRPSQLPGESRADPS
jgi:uncharacterized RDD family membrane protein YckC